MIMTREFAAGFAAEWIAAWNARDLPRVLAHYSEDVEMSSPFIIRIAGEPSGCLRGKEKLMAYWQKALRQNPGLHFELLDVFVGANSVVLHYRNNSGERAAEMLIFNKQGLVCRAAAHYNEN
ncbi:MAG TPA: nuclear transport factor 2 family protein [Candidatus Acidoferrales bacterium]|nr:nuclear transport factor 2 family protein [Candidatus Acidoferrales bacterium]